MRGRNVMQCHVIMSFVVRKEECDICTVHQYTQSNLLSSPMPASLSTSIVLCCAVLCFMCGLVWS